MPSLPLPLPLFLLLLLLVLPYTTSSNPYNYSIHVDCGGPTDSTDVFGVQWLSDRHFSGGATAIVSEPLLFHHTQEKTLRYFPISSGKKNCYSIPLAGDHISAGQKFVAKKKFVAGNNVVDGKKFVNGEKFVSGKNFVDGEKFVVGEKFVDGGGGGGGGGRYLVRTFTVYDNYNGKHHTPSFDVSVSGTVVFSWRSPWPESVSRGGAYSDLIVSVPEDHGEIDVCFYSIATDAPLIASLELFQIDPDAYVNGPVLNSSILVNYGRFSAGSGQWGPGFSNDTDRFGRSWQSDAGHRSQAAALATGSTIKAISALKKVVNADRAPNYFPPKLYESAVTIIGEGGGFLEYELQVDAKLDYLLWFHFAEINLSVTKAGQRVFDVIVNGENVSRVDIFKEVGGFSAYDFSYVVKNLSSTTLNVRIESVVGRPLICGLENYAIVPADFKTVPDQVIAMKALKESLRVPDRMGWNGDPCAPTTWDAWEGVTCRMNKDETAIVISQIDLGSQGLKGYISDQISLLTNLASLNLSSNSLQGTLPSGLGQKSLVKLDLSNNKFTGPIPESLTSSSLQLVLLNNNELDGLVPEELYSVGVHGGAIDLSSNKGLCGVPSLPDCPMFWGKDGLSTGGKVAIALSCLLVLCLVSLAVCICIRRRRNDYDFGLPSELVALSAKRNRYQRQKSLMTLELESQHAKGFIPTYNPNS